ncbi:MAG: colicin immunity domain-containing protein [Chloroflexota bacterium]|nr:hypothetical protein [Chloroflexota bacterium]
MSPQEYKKMLQKFVNGVLSVEGFETLYLTTFKSDMGGMYHPLYEILEAVFEAVDAYWYECKLGEETAFVISEERLRQEVKMALNSLNDYIYDNFKK